ncbi:MAG: tetratricopeptide repeat protein [Nitrosomonadales bacterium]|nr:tetratricopeptide repeat protein [Nitrosomonadales bacterium]
MKTCSMILSAASIIPLLSSCASYQKTADSAAWSVKPTYNVKHSSETPESYYQLGRYYQGQNRYEQALAAYQKALAIDGTFAEARNGLGVIYAMQGKQQEALEQFRLAMKQAPNAAHIQNNLGYALYLSKSYAEAASTLARAVALNPANHAAHTNLALALDKAGDREKAVQVMAQETKPQAVENVPPVTQQVQQVQQVRTVTPPPVAAPTVATAAIPSPAPQQVLALPKDWGVIKQAARKPVPQVESRVQAVQLAPNVYELRGQTEVHVQTVSVDKPLQQAAAQPNGHGEPPGQMMKQRFATTVSLSPNSLPKGERDGVSLRESHVKERNMVVAQAAQKPVPAAEMHVRTIPHVSSVAEQPVRAAAPVVRPYSIEVSNGNGVTGMARKVAGFLDSEGYARAHLTNQKPFKVASSQVQYRSGYREQALSLASTLPGQPGIVQVDNLRSDISLRVLLGKDLAGNVAYFQQGQGKIRLALKSDS